MSVYERLMWKFAWDSGPQLPSTWHDTRYGFTVSPRLVVMDNSTNSDKLAGSSSTDLDLCWVYWQSQIVQILLDESRNDGWMRRHPRIFRVFKKKPTMQRSKVMGHCLASNSVIQGRVKWLSALGCNRCSIYRGYSTCSRACDLQWLYPSVSLVLYHPFTISSQYQI